MTVVQHADYSAAMRAVNKTTLKPEDDRLKRNDAVCYTKQYTTAVCDLNVRKSRSRVNSETLQNRLTKHTDRSQCQTVWSVKINAMEMNTENSC
jgi:hypothetical protein